MRCATRILRAISLVLAAALLLPTVLMAATRTNLPAMDPGMVQQRLVQRGVGHLVKVVRTDGTEVRGRISAVRADAVDLGVGRELAPVTVGFGSVADVRKPGLSKGAKIGIWVGVGVVVTVGVLALVVDHELKKPWGPIG